MVLGHGSPCNSVRETPLGQFSPSGIDTKRGCDKYYRPRGVSHSRGGRPPRPLVPRRIPPVPGYRDRHTWILHLPVTRRLWLEPGGPGPLPRGSDGIGLHRKNERPDQEPEQDGPHYQVHQAPDDQWDLVFVNEEGPRHRERTGRAQAGQEVDLCAHVYLYAPSYSPLIGRSHRLGVPCGSLSSVDPFL